ncbi:MAG: hypothetical protein ACH34U_08420 [Cyanobium sp.]
MSIPDRLALLWGTAFFSGAAGQWLSRISGVPAVVVLLGVGLLIGQTGLGLMWGAGRSWRHGWRCALAVAWPPGRWWAGSWRSCCSCS